MWVETMLNLLITVLFPYSTFLRDPLPACTESQMSPCLPLYSSIHPAYLGLPWRNSRLRIWCCHCCSSDHGCGMGSILGPGNFCIRWVQPKKKTKKIRTTYCFLKKLFIALACQCHSSLFFIAYIDPIKHFIFFFDYFSANIKSLMKSTQAKKLVSHLSNRSLLSNSPSLDSIWWWLF